MPTAERTDRELIDAIRHGGDPDAVETVVRRHTGRVRAIIYPLVLNDADADDVTQLAWLNALRGLATFRGESAWTSWLHRVAVNTARNFLRSRGRRRRREEIEDPSDELADPRHETPAGNAEADDADRAVTAALARLPAEQRIALSLVALQGMPEREAAAAAGCACATLRWRVFRARQRLRPLLKDHAPCP